MLDRREIIRSRYQPRRNEWIIETSHEPMPASTRALSGLAERCERVQKNACCQLSANVVGRVHDRRATSGTRDKLRSPPLHSRRGARKNGFNRLRLKALSRCRRKWRGFCPLSHGTPGYGCRGETVSVLSGLRVKRAFSGFRKRLLILCFRFALTNHIIMTTLAGTQRSLHLHVRFRILEKGLTFLSSMFPPSKSRSLLRFSSGLPFAEAHRRHH